MSDSLAAVSWAPVPKLKGEPDDGTTAEQACLANEDETLGMPLREQLLQDPAVIEASFAMDSRERDATLRIRVVDGSNPREAYASAVRRVKGQVAGIHADFLKARAAHVVE